VGVPVAEPLLVEKDPSVLGYPFMVSRRASGVTVPHTVGLNVGAEHLETARALAELLAKLHNLDVSSLDLPRTYYDPALSTPEAILRSLEHWERTWLEVADRSSITLPCAFEWLRVNVPAAMLDWECAHVGDPVEDLTYCRLWIDQIMPFDDFLRHYFVSGGPAFSVDAAKFYSVYISVRSVLTSLRGYYLLQKAPHPQMSAVMAKLKYARLFEIRVAEAIAPG
jgi:aminoglycoside phosphotransferase (APT) family kinase protein